MTSACDIKADSLRRSQVDTYVVIVCTAETDCVCTYAAELVKGPVA